MPFDCVAFRVALSQFATGVTVVTARGVSGDAIGMTMSSFNSVSLDPPLILFSVDRRAHSLAGLLQAKGYAVNVLNRRQVTLSDQFSRVHGNKWHAVEHWGGHAGAPLLCGAVAHFECEPYAWHDGGDHIIFVGRVVGFNVNADEEPLLFFRGGYHSVSCRAEDLPEERP